MWLGDRVEEVRGATAILHSERIVRRRTHGLAETPERHHSILATFNCIYAHSPADGCQYLLWSAASASTIIRERGRKRCFDVRLTLLKVARG